MKGDNYLVGTFFKKVGHVACTPSLVKRKVKKMVEVKSLCGPRTGKKNRLKKRSFLIMDNESSSLPNGSSGPIQLAKPDNFLRFSQLSESLKLSLENNQSEGNIFSGGAILCCDHVSDSDVVQGNFRFWDHLESNIGEKLVKIISNIGVMANGGEKDYRKKIL